jgi:hypothetical protein
MQQPDILSAMSYGPFSYVKAALMGFLAGNGVFFLMYAMISGSHQTYGTINAKAILMGCVGGGVAIAVILAALGNYVIGRTLRLHQLIQREIFSASELPLLPRVEEAQYDLGSPAMSFGKMPEIHAQEDA